MGDYTLTAVDAKSDCTLVVVADLNLGAGKCDTAWITTYSNRDARFGVIDRTDALTVGVDIAALKKGEPFYALTT